MRPVRGLSFDVAVGEVHHVFRVFKDAAPAALLLARSTGSIVVIDVNVTTAEAARAWGGVTAEERWEDGGRQPWYERIEVRATTTHEAGRPYGTRDRGRRTGGSPRRR